MALTLVLTVVGMYVGMRIAGPVTRSYNLGSVTYEISPARHGKTEIVVPHAGLRLEAHNIHAPFVLRVEPTSFSLTALAEAAVGVQSSLSTARSDIVHGATWAFVRAFLYALAGGLVAAALAALLVFFFFRLGTAILCAVLGVVLTLVVVGGSAVWVWQAHYVRALEHPTVVAGPSQTNLDLAPVVRKLRRSHSLEDIIRNLAPLLEQVARG